MSYRDDYISRQIKNIVSFLRKLIKREEDQDKLLFKRQVDRLESDYEEEILDFKDNLNRLLSLSRVNEAENLIFEIAKYKKIDYLLISLEFYDKLTRLDDKELEDLRFSRNEIEEGIDDLLELYGYDYLNLINRGD